MSLKTHNFTPVPVSHGFKLEEKHIHSLIKPVFRTSIDVKLLCKIVFLTKTSWRRRSPSLKDLPAQINGQTNKNSSATLTEGEKTRSCLWKLIPADLRAGGGSIKAELSLSEGTQPMKSAQSLFLTMMMMTTMLMMTACVSAGPLPSSPEHARWDLTCTAPIWGSGPLITETLFCSQAWRDEPDQWQPDKRHQVRIYLTSLQWLTLRWSMIRDSRGYSAETSSLDQ